MIVRVSTRCQRVEEAQHEAAREVRSTLSRTATGSIQTRNGSKETSKEGDEERKELQRMRVSAARRAKRGEKRAMHEASNDNRAVSGSTTRKQHPKCDEMNGSKKSGVRSSRRSMPACRRSATRSMKERDVRSEARDEQCMKHQHDNRPVARITSWRALMH